MIGRIEPDCLLAQRFFTAPPARRDLDLFKCDFPLPSSAMSMARFFSNPGGYQCCKGVEHIIRRLKRLGYEKRIDMSALDVFYSNLNHQNPDVRYHFPYTPASYQLMTEGLKMLTAIATLLESEAVSDDLKERVLKIVGSDLNVCAPGCYTAIQGAYMKLIKSPDVSLLEIRVEIAQQVAQELIKDYNRSIETRPDYEFLHVYEGNHTHYIAGLLNHTAEEFGFEINHDKYIPRYSKIHPFVQPFRDKVSSQLTGQILVNQILEKLNVNDYLQKIKASPNKATEYCDNFKDELDCYGIDDEFDINSLFDQDELMNLSYVLSSDAENYLIISILIRLTKSGFINTELASRKIMLEPNVELTYFPYHPLSFSYVIINDLNKRKPFISYCIEYMKTNNMMPIELDTQNHAAELHHALIAQIKEEDIFELIPPSMESDADKLSCYALINSLPYSRLLVKMFTLMRRSVVDAFLVFIDEANKRAKFSNAAQYDAAVQCYFVQNRVYFSSKQDLEALSKFVNSIQDLHTALYFVVEPERYHFLLLSGAKIISHISSEAKNAAAVLLLLSIEDRYRLLQHLHFSSEFSTKIDLLALISMLNLIAPEHYHEMINFMIGDERFARLIPDIDTYLQVLGSITLNRRFHFVKAVNSGFLNQLMHGTITNLGRVMAHLSVSDQHELLSFWYQGGYQGLFASFELLQGYLLPLQPESRSAFVRSLPADLLQELVTDALKLGMLLQLIPEEEYAPLLKQMQNEHIKSLLPNSEKLTTALYYIIGPARTSFLTCFAKLFNVVELQQFMSGDNALYDELMDLRGRSVISSVTSYLGSLFASPPQTHVSAEQREMMRMRQYDSR